MPGKVFIENKKKFGQDNEKEIANYLNHKRFDQLNDKWKGHMKKMFPNIKDDSYIIAYKNPDGYAKPDIVIRVGDYVQYVSIKTGRNPQVHVENCYSFFRFLNSIGVSFTATKIIYFFHFGQTKKLSNHGIPFTKEEIEENFPDYLDMVNVEINSNDEIIKKIINRCIFQGKDEFRQKATFLYYGQLERGILLSAEEITNIIIRDKSSYHKPIHFGGLTYQAGSRNQDSIELTKCKIRWPLLTVLFYDNDPDKYIMQNYQNEMNEID